MHYRPEIDGLRAIAVAVVILFHAGISGFGGGFIGVDIFFVLSGFLITGILLEEQSAKGSISISGFYDRRVRRIAPALFFVLIPTTVAATVLMVPDELRFFGVALASSILFTSNIIFWRDAGYFQADSETNPLIHTWSLSVEEQFYIFFPLLLIGLARASKRTKFSVVVVLFLVSFGWAHYSATRFPEQAFFLLPARIWELTAGALLAFYRRELPLKSKPWVSDCVMLAALGAIIGSTVYLDSASPWPGVLALPTILATCLLIAFASPATIVGRVLSSPPFRALGLISYSLYLWHQPIMAFLRLRLGELTTPLAILSIVGSLIMAWVSWKFVEQPFRNRRFLNKRTIFLGAGSFGAILVAIGGVLYLSKGLPQRLPAEAAAIESQHSKTRTFDDCLGTPRNRTSESEACFTTGERQIALWGDSHAASLAEPLSDALAKHQIGLTQLTYISCPPGIRLLVPKNLETCQTRNAQVLDRLTSSNEFDTVVLSARWPLYLAGQRFNNREGGIEPGSPLAVRVDGQSDSSEASRQQALRGDFSAAVKALLDSGRQVIVIGPIPEAGWNVPKALQRSLFYGESTEKTTSYQVYLDRTEGSLNWVPAQAKIVEVDTLFCNETTARCSLFRDGKPLYWDDNHVGETGGQLIADAVVEQVVKGD